MGIALVLTLILAFRSPAVAGEDGGFVALFDGKTLDGWEQHGGKAKYYVEDGAIVGQSVPNTPNSFLCTKKKFKNFILEYEFLCDPQLNSGVQFRSNVYDKPVEYTYKTRNGKTATKTVPAGRVHGYQAEIDPNKPDRMWTAGVYDEGRRGWLFPGLCGGDPKKFTEQGKRLFRPGAWNHVRVECRGDHIRTWLNGELRADFHDDLTPEGFVGLQVHGVGGRKDPLRVRWRNLRIKELD
ncbi:MAG: DUF1080 domain-containing protein [Planctomycetota bacterium]|nr:MAG: DUF1080 domain-containing protein [Planctomycetota bacterium]